MVFGANATACRLTRCTGIFEAPHTNLRLPEKFQVVFLINGRILYSELNLNQYSVGSPCRTICTVCGSPPCPDLNLIHYICHAKPRQNPCCSHRNPRLRTLQTAAAACPNQL